MQNSKQRIAEGRVTKLFAPFLRCASITFKSYYSFSNVISVAYSTFLLELYMAFLPLCEYTGVPQVPPFLEGASSRSVIEY
jgi:hypothetical protein